MNWNQRGVPAAQVRKRGRTDTNRGGPPPPPALSAPRANP
jgi:hypothetical protein